VPSKPEGLFRAEGDVIESVLAYDDVVISPLFYASFSANMLGESSLKEFTYGPNDFLILACSHRHNPRFDQISADRSVHHNIYRINLVLYHVSWCIP
jgi:hypothetical protein